PCHLGFTYDITAPFQRFEEQASFERPTDPEMDAVLDGSGEIEPAIIHRARNHRYRSSGTTEVVGRDRTAQELAKLYRIGLDMGAASNASELSNVVLEALFSETSADIGAILLLAHGATTTPAQ